MQEYSKPDILKKDTEERNPNNDLQKDPQTSPEGKVVISQINEEENKNELLNSIRSSRKSAHKEENAKIEIEPQDEVKTLEKPKIEEIKSDMKISPVKPLESHNDPRKKVLVEVFLRQIKKIDKRR